MAKFRGTNNFMGAWQYVLLDILYSIPVIGWIVLLIHAMDKNNENRMHFARSRFAHALVVGIILLVLFIIVYINAIGPYNANREAYDKVFDVYRLKFNDLLEDMQREINKIAAK